MQKFTCTTDETAQGLLDFPQGHAVSNPLTRSCKQCLSVKKQVSSSVVCASVNQGGNSWGGGAVAPPTFGQQHFFLGFHTPLTVRSGVNGFFDVSHYGNVR